MQKEEVSCEEESSVASWAEECSPGGEAGLQGDFDLPVAWLWWAEEQLVESGEDGGSFLC